MWPLEGRNPVGRGLAVASARGAAWDAARGPASAPILVPHRNDQRFGLDASAAAQVLRLKLRRDSAGLGGWASYVIAVVPIAMGLHLLGWVRIPMPSASARTRAKGVAGAFASGLLLSLALALCGTPVLAAALSFAAHEGNPAYGAALLFAYGLGIGLPMLLLGTAASGLALRLERLGKTAWVDRLAGGALLALGFYLMWIA